MFCNVSFILVTVACFTYYVISSNIFVNTGSGAVFIYLLKVF